jgi:hypothetical protein
MSKSPRQIFYSDHQENTLDEKSRTLKEKRILAMLNDYIISDMRIRRCLGIGCSGGIISRAWLARFCFGCILCLDFAETWGAVSGLL